VPKDIHLDILEVLFCDYQFGHDYEAKLLESQELMENRHESHAYSFVMVGVWYFSQYSYLFPKEKK
jgi:hypothetical protein